MDRETAKMLSDLMIQHNSEFNKSLIKVKETCSEKIFNQYRDTVSKLLLIEYEEVMIPIYKLYPDLKPEGLD